MPKLTTPLFAVVAVSFVLALTGCGGGDKDHKDHDHKDHGHKDHDHDHGPADVKAGKDTGKHAPGHGGEVIALGDGAFGPYKVRATRDKGVIKAGSDAPFDVWVDLAATLAPKVVAVRFWIGAQDAKGSVKAKAEIENPKDPNRWHTHAEIPDPLPAGAKLWVEIEDDKGATTLASFELKA